MGPHIVVATLGTNDAKESNWDAESFEKDYLELLMEFFERMNPRPQIWLVQPPPIYEDGAYEIQQDVVNSELPQIVAGIADKAMHTVNDPMLAMAKKHKVEIPEGVLIQCSVIE